MKKITVCSPVIHNVDGKEYCFDKAIEYAKEAKDDDASNG